MNTKDKILAAALKLFVNQGINQTSTNLIAKEAGVAAGTIFVHFKSKQEIVDTLYLNGKRSLFEATKDSIDQTKTSKENHYNLSRNFINHSLQNHLEYEFQKMVKRGIDISQEVASQADKLFAGNYDYTRQSIKNGDLAQVDPQLIFSLSWNSMNTIIGYCQSQNLREVPEEYIDFIWNQVKAG
jgi:AcrR family transcriptional regulator